MVKTFKQFKNGKVKKVGNPIFANNERLLTLGVPSSFDSRTQWPSCIHSVRNQKSCGSCYAFSAVGMLEDRFCITT
jgi:cathepsin B